jgi:hypothetical protein
MRSAASESCAHMRLSRAGSVRRRALVSGGKRCQAVPSGAKRPHAVEAKPALKAPTRFSSAFACSGTDPPTAFQATQYSSDPRTPDEPCAQDW